MESIALAGIEAVTEVTVTAIKEGKVVGQKDGAEVEYPCDYAVMAIGSKARCGKEIEEGARAIGAGYMVIGDAAMARRALNAVREAFDAALTFDDPQVHADVTKPQKIVAVTGVTGTMGQETLKQLLPRGNRFKIRAFARPSEVNREKMKKFYHSFLIAFSMYSKIPMPQCEWNEENMAYAMCFFPWIGVAIGGVTWLWGTFGTYLGLSSAFYTVILTLIPWFLTGGIHLDGLLDTADAMSSWQERERRLEILKDSNSGAFAVIICAVYFMFYYGVYSQISARALAMIPFTFCLSRTLSGLAIVTFPKAKKTGSVSAMARGAKDRQVKATMCVYLLILLAGMLLVDWKLGLLVYGIAILVYALYYRNAMKYFGGTTGDLAGCFLSLCEVFMACGAVLGALWF